LRHESYQVTRHYSAHDFGRLIEDPERVRVLKARKIGATFCQSFHTQMLLGALSAPINRNAQKVRGQSSDPYLNGIQR
jgi:hypothetical protein